MVISEVISVISLVIPVISVISDNRRTPIPGVFTVFKVVNTGKSAPFI